MDVLEKSERFSEASRGYVGAGIGKGDVEMRHPESDKPMKVTPPFKRQVPDAHLW